ncbi:DUF1566 domain-containing protein [Stieleria sp. JC731]|uniref:Lcl C-terminal domain-containing protein n=1 Tax=Pirellulaceae TaxID=2691357 RepID=UPI001E2AE271|nr:DUF1566 domain-containing protein [Stieleria sp. JC731]MCC9599600.1 DUF1566 domain-containing protein [Stieleria sp. JC731]
MFSRLQSPDYNRTKRLCLVLQLFATVAIYTAVQHPPLVHADEPAEALPSEIETGLLSTKPIEIRRAIDYLLRHPRQAFEASPIVVKRRNHPEFGIRMPQLFPMLSRDEIAKLSPDDQQRIRKSASLEPKPSFGLPTRPSSSLPNSPATTNRTSMPPAAAFSSPASVASLGGQHNQQHLDAILKMTPASGVPAAEIQLLPLYLSTAYNAPLDLQTRVAENILQLNPSDPSVIEAFLKFGQRSPHYRIQGKVTKHAMKLKTDAGLIQANRFVDHGFYVEDRETGLLWQTDGSQSGKHNFFEAQRYADQLVLQRLQDWRVPTAGELATIFPATELPFRHSGYTPTISQPSHDYWTSHQIGADYAVLYQWYDEGGANNCIASSNRAFVRCVHDPMNRSGQRGRSINAAD